MRRKEVKAVLFDMDGVLVDSADAWYLVFNDALRHFGLNTLSRKDFIRDFGAPIEYDAKKHFRGMAIKKVEKAYNLNFRKRAGHVKIFPESISVLQKLKDKKVKLGMITNSTKSITNEILNHFKIKKYFKVIITMNDVKRGKPAPDMILKACRILKANPKNTILVGDTMNDITAGRRAGCIIVGYKIKGDYRIDELGSAIEFVELQDTLSKKQKNLYTGAHFFSL